MVLGNSCSLERNARCETSASPRQSLRRYLLLSTYIVSIERCRDADIKECVIATYGIDSHVTQSTSLLSVMVKEKSIKSDKKEVHASTEYVGDVEMGDTMAEKVCYNQTFA